MPKSNGCSSLMEGHLDNGYRMRVWTDVRAGPELPETGYHWGLGRKAAVAHDVEVHVVASFKGSGFSWTCELGLPT